MNVLFELIMARAVNPCTLKTMYTFCRKLLGSDLELELFASAIVKLNNVRCIRLGLQRRGERISIPVNPFHNHMGKVTVEINTLKLRPDVNIPWDNLIMWQSLDELWKYSPRIVDTNCYLIQHKLMEYKYCKQDQCLRYRLNIAAQRAYALAFIMERMELCQRENPSTWIDLHALNHAYLGINIINYAIETLVQMGKLMCCVNSETGNQLYHLALVNV